MKGFKSKIEELGEIKPDKSFVVNTKATILVPEKEENFAFYPVLKRAFLVVPLVFAVIFGLYFYNRNIRYPHIASLDIRSIEEVSRDLQEVEGGLAEAREGLERVKNPEDLLALRERVASTLKESEKVVKTSREVAKGEAGATSEEFETMTVLSSTTEKVEKATKDLEETYILKQKEVARMEIEEMEEKSLTDKQSSLLQEAKDLYNKGVFAEALEKVLEAQSY